MHKLLLLAPAAVLGCAVSVFAQLPQNAGTHYSFAFIDPPDVRPSAVSGVGINDDGDVVGFYRTQINCYEPGDVCDLGYLKDNAGYRTVYFGDAGYTFVSGINDSGMMVGTCCGIHSAHSPGFEYDIQSGSLSRVLAPGSQATFFTSVNSLGVIGGYSELPGSPTIGFLLQNGVFTQIAYPGASGTYVRGVNSSNQAVGNAVIGTTSQAFLYQNGAFQALNYPGAAGASANGINDVGDIVGTYALPNSTASYGFVYSKGVFAAFDQPNCNGTIPQGINNHGVIVGESCGGAFIATHQSN